MTEAPASSAPPARAGAARRKTHPDAVLIVGVVLILVATAFRAWTLSRSWFYVDDFPMVAGMSRDGLTLDGVLSAYNGHLMPAGRLAAWLISLDGPWNYRLAAIQLAALFALAGVGVLRVLRTLFGPHPAVLGLLAFFLMTPWLVPSTTWWAAGINHLPALAASAFALDAVVRYLRFPARRHLVASVAWMVFGLCFAELTLIGYIPIAIIACGYFATGSLRERLRALWRTHRTPVVVHVALVLVYVPTYLARSHTPTQTGVRPWRVYLIDMIATVIPGTFVGGPTRWLAPWPAQFEAHPPIPLQLLGIAALGGVVALAAATRVRSLRAWLIPIAEALVIVALFAQNRRAFVPALILDLRFSAPLALGFTLAVGLAFLPVRGAVESAEPREGRNWPIRSAWVIVALVVFAGLAVRSAATFPLVDNPGKSPRAFFATFEESVSEHEQPVDLIDIPTPGYVYGFGADASYSTMLSAYGDEVDFPRVVQDDYYVLDDDGHLVPPDFEVARRAEPATPTADCRGYLVDASETTIPLDGPVLGYVWRLQLAYSADRTTPATIVFGGETVAVTFERGEHVMEMQASAPDTWDEITIDGLDPGAEVCVTQALVGTTTVPDA